MRVTGTVVAVANGRARVLVDAAGQDCAAGCCSCATAASCGRQVEAVASGPVEPGATVSVEIGGASAVVSALLLFLLPLLGLVGGVVLGQGGRAAGSRVSGSSLALGFALFALLFAVACVVDRKVVQPRLPEPRIVAVLRAPPPTDESSLR